MNKNDDKKVNFLNIYKKRKYIFVFCLLLVFSMILITSCYGKNIKNENKKVIKDMIMNNNQENSKILNTSNLKRSTPEECKEKGLHYIGEMTAPRIFHKSIKLDDSNILVLGGYSEIKSKKNILKGDYEKKIEYIPEYSAEIFNLNNNMFEKLPSTLDVATFVNSMVLPNGNLLFVSNKYTIFNKKTRKFKSIERTKINSNINYKSIYPQFTELIGENCIIECYGQNDGFNNHNMCWITDINEFVLRSINKINLNVPEYLIPCSFGYLKINDDTILIYTKSYPRTNAKNVYFAIFDLKNKKNIREKEIKDIGSSFNSQPPVLLDENKILFAGGVELKPGTYIPIKNVFPYFLYDIKNDKLEKIDETELKKINTRKNLNIEKNKMKSDESMEFYGISNQNIIQINDNQLFVSGGKKKHIDNKKGEIVRSAWIYTF